MMPYSAFPPTRRRSRRLRKKLHIDEFREMGFAVSFALPDAASTRATSAFWDAFIELIESRALAFGGGDASGYVTKSGRGAASEADREAVQAWLSSRTDVSGVAVGALEDAWYGPTAQGAV